MMMAAMEFLWPSMEFLWPSWWEVQVTLVSAAFVVVAYWYFTLGCDGGGGDDRTFMGAAGADVILDKEKQLYSGLLKEFAAFGLMDLLESEVANRAENVGLPSFAF